MSTPSALTPPAFEDDDGALFGRRQVRLAEQHLEDLRRDDPARWIALQAEWEDEA